MSETFGTEFFVIDEHRTRLAVKRQPIYGGQLVEVGVLEAEGVRVKPLWYRVTVRHEAKGEMRTELSIPGHGTNSIETAAAYRDAISFAIHVAEELRESGRLDLDLGEPISAAELEKLVKELEARP